MALLTVADALRTVLSDLPYWELPQYTERFVDEGTCAVRRLACYWKDRKQFVRDFLGDSKIVGGKLRRDLPEQHPDFSDPDGLIWSMWAGEMELVQTAGWPGRDSSTESIAFHDSLPQYSTGGDPPVTTMTRAANGDGLAIYDVTYRPTLYAVISDEEADDSEFGELSRFVHTTYEPAGENLPVPKGMFVFEGDPLSNTYNELAPILFPNAVISYHWRMIPTDGFRWKTVLGYFDDAAGVMNLVQGAMAAVNSVEFLGFKKGSLLCLPPVLQKYMHANTGIYYNMTFQMQYRPQGHTRFLRPKMNGLSAWFQKLLRVDDQTKGVYEEFDFYKLFDVNQP